MFKVFKKWSIESFSKDPGFLVVHGYKNIRDLEFLKSYIESRCDTKVIIAKDIEELYRRLRANRLIIMPLQVRNGEIDLDFFRVSCGLGRYGMNRIIFIYMDQESQELKVKSEIIAEPKQHPILDYVRYAYGETLKI